MSHPASGTGGGFDLIEAELAAVATETVRVASGVTLVGPGMPARLVLLQEGWAIRTRAVGDSARQVLDILLPGDAAGIDTVLHGTTRHCIESVTAATVRRSPPLTAADLAADPVLALSVQRRLALRAERAETFLANIGRRDALERMSWLMLDVLTRMEERALCRGGWCPFPLQRAHLADALGLSVTHVSRTLQELEGRGLVQLGGGFLSVLDRAGLQAVCGYEAPVSARVAVAA
ncbi:MAG TPA: Crp/Fnr family transcriptional regulator [Azospirillaceae bacterium]|nr:Crp/Fnr family transcriptional regulator [Azospirillaceae bacterium]